MQARLKHPQTYIKTGQWRCVPCPALLSFAWLLYRYIAARRKRQRDRQHMRQTGCLSTRLMPKREAASSVQQLHTRQPES